MKVKHEFTPVTITTENETEYLDLIHFLRVAYYQMDREACGRFGDFNSAMAWADMNKRKILTLLTQLKAEL